MGKCKRKFGSSSSKDSFSNFSNSSDGNKNTQQVFSSSSTSCGSNLSGLSRHFKKSKLGSISQSSSKNGSQLSEIFAKYGYSENRQSTNQNNNVKLSSTSQNSSNNNSQLFKILVGHSGYATRTKKSSQNSDQNERNAEKKLFEHSAPKQSFSSDAISDIANHSESIKEHFSQLTQELIGEVDVEYDIVDKETSQSDDLEYNGVCTSREFIEKSDEFEFSKHLNKHFSKDINDLKISENSTVSEDVNLNDDSWFDEVVKINQSPENSQNTNLKVDNIQSKNNLFTSNYINTQQDRDRECSENASNFEDYLQNISFDSSEKIKIQPEDFNFYVDTFFKDRITSYSASQPNVVDRLNNSLTSETLDSKNNFNDASKKLRVGLNHTSQETSLIYADSNLALHANLRTDNIQSQNNRFALNYIDSQQDGDTECSKKASNFENYVKDSSFDSSEEIRKIRLDDFDQETSSSIISYDFSRPNLAETLTNSLRPEAVSTGSKNNVNDAAEGIGVDLNHISQDKSLISADSNLILEVNLGKDDLQSNNNSLTSNCIHAQQDPDRECSENASNFEDYLKDISFNSSEKIRKIQLEDFDFDEEPSSKDVSISIISCNFSQPHVTENLSNSLNSEALSTGSKSNFDDAAKRLRVGLNHISRDKSLIYAGTNLGLDVNLGPQKKERIKSKIEDVLQWFTRGITENQRLVFKVRNNKKWSNCIFQNDVLQLKPHQESIFTAIKYTARTSRQKFNLILYLLIKNYVLLQTDSFSTQREIYYQIKNFTDTQDKIRLAMNTISSMLNIEPWYFPIMSTSKGLVFGDLSLIISEEEIIRCNAFGGTLIPQDVTKIREIKSKAFFILVVEKDAIFKKLLDEDIPNKLTRPFIIVTGKGFPDINTRLFIKKLWMSLRIPAFILVDADPDGINIMLTYRFGSLCMAHVSEQLALPQIRWLGVFPSEIKKLKITHQTLNDLERNKIRDMLERPYVKENPWLKRELEVLKENDLKAEIEGVIKSSAFLTDVYLPSKFYSRDYF